MSTEAQGPTVKPEDTYQIDSEEYDSDEEKDALEDDEYDKLVAEAENGYTEEEVRDMISGLKERGIVNFLLDYLKPGPTGEVPSLRKLLLSLGIIPPKPLRNVTSDLALLPFTKIALSRILRRREKLPQHNTVEDAVKLIRKSKNIIVLSGAGISTSVGIPDFRSANGLYAQLQEEGKYDLDDPQDMFDMRVFRERPEVFYSFAKQIYPSSFVPSACHRWIKSLEDRGVLLRNYTQNIDTLEAAAGVTKVLQCHGSFSTASCLRCKTQMPGSSIEPHIMQRKVPYCEGCGLVRDERLAERKRQAQARRKAKGKGKANGWDSGSEDSLEEDEWEGGEPGIIKPDITFFGQASDSKFDEHLYRDREEIDLLIIIGTSLKVAPVSEVVTHIPHSVPQILINLTPVNHIRPDICLLGDGDSIIQYLAEEVGWEIPPSKSIIEAEETELNHSRAKHIPPEEVAWITSPDLPHVHLLSSKADYAARLDALTRIQNNVIPSQTQPDCILNETSTVDHASQIDDAAAVDEEADLMSSQVGEGGAEEGYESDIEAGRTVKKPKTTLTI